MGDSASFPEVCRSKRKSRPYCQRTALRNLYDEKLNSSDYYRIKQVFDNGVIRYSPLRDLDFPDHSALELFPNPAQHTLFVQLNEENEQSATVFIYTALGQLVEQHIVEAFPDNWEMSLDGYLSGWYQMNILLEDGRRLSKGFVVEKGN